MKNVASVMHGTWKNMRTYKTKNVLKYIYACYCTSNIATMTWINRPSLHFIVRRQLAPNWFESVNHLTRCPMPCMMSRWQIVSRGYFGSYVWNGRSCHLRIEKRHFWVRRQLARKYIQLLLTILSYHVLYIPSSIHHAYGMHYCIYACHTHQGESLPNKLQP